MKNQLPRRVHCPCLVSSLFKNLVTYPPSRCPQTATIQQIHQVVGFQFQSL